MAVTTDLELTQVETIDGLMREYESFAALVGALTEREWATPSRCVGFDVRDVAGHVIGVAEDLAVGMADRRSVEAQAASVRDDPPPIAAARLAVAMERVQQRCAALDDQTWTGPGPMKGLTFDSAIRVVWYDIFVHTDDIRCALGRGHHTGPGERVAVAVLRVVLSMQGFGPVHIDFTDRDYPPIELGDASDGAAPAHRLGVHEFIMAATGRLDAGSVGLDPAVNVYAG